MANPEETVDAELLEQTAPDDSTEMEESQPAQMTGAEYIGAALERLGFEPDDDAEDYEEYIGSSSIEDIEPPLPAVISAPKPKTGFKRWQLGLLAVPGLAAIAVLAFVAIVMLSTASVALVTKTDTIDLPMRIVVGASAQAVEQGEVSNGVSLAGAAQIPANTIEVVISESGDTPVFGSVTQPDKTASGTVQATNPYPLPITVPASTQVGVVKGIAYYTTEDVSIGPGDPFGALSFGTASLPVTADKPGAEGNIPARSLIGQLENGVYIVNDEPISGGTDKQVLAVSEDDRMLLRKGLEEKIRNAALDTLKANLKPGQQLIAPSISFADWQAEFDHVAGDQAEKVHLTLKGRVTALAYSNSDIEQAVNKAVEQSVTKRNTGDAKWSLSKVSHSKLQLISEDQEKAVFQTDVKATVSYSIDDAALEKIRSNITGKSVQDAEAYLKSLPYLQSYSLVRSPGWFPWDRLPASADRIAIDVGEQGMSSR